MTINIELIYKVNFSMTMKAKQVSQDPSAHKSAHPPHELIDTIIQLVRLNFSLLLLQICHCIDKCVDQTMVHLHA